MLKHTLIYCFVLSSCFMFGQDEVVNLHNFDSEKLNRYLVEYTNQVRSKKRRSNLLYFTVLDSAAKNQAQYMARKNYLGHYQKNRKLKTVKDRVELLGGNADYIGENVQFISINYEIESAKSQLTYAALAKILGDNWRSSKGHYSNMIDKSYEGVSHQFAIKDGLLYACQVLSSKSF